MRVIGVGFGRTGTASLRVALERLGYGPCYHMFSVLAEPARARGWLAAAKAVEAADGAVDPPWEEIFDGYDSTLDWPGVAFWRELVEAYPDARVILTVRDPYRWHQSMDETILRALRNSRSPVLGRLMQFGARLRPDLGAFWEMIDRVVVRRSFGGDVGGGPERFVRMFDEHSAEVIAAVPAERLLVFEVADGWKPLCDFLGTTAPDEPFPHVNERAEFARIAGTQQRKVVVPALAGVVTALAAAVIATRALRRRH
ncbi:sulfotransferase family protein [Catenuloplanes atrovinosus]|uniref:Sulfotransferase family protein n=1 Tax=Catenuloplanes atrovinosus TaxID=137266 RepID=A0AAE3YK75_9ACTN|nr:sulfotransferase [Catenuloplanes atrovinosus]MDR7273693.1 hypothetical protein [Catenuloplanes atrovinosus]